MGGVWGGGNGSGGEKNGNNKPITSLPTQTLFGQIHFCHNVIRERGEECVT